MDVQRADDRGDREGARDEDVRESPRLRGRGSVLPREEGRLRGGHVQLHFFSFLLLFSRQGTLLVTVTIEERAASRVRSQRVRTRNEVAGVHDSSPTRSRARARDGTLGRSRWCFVLAPFAVGKRKPSLARPIRARVAPGNAQNSDRSASSLAPARRRVSHARVSRGYGEKRAWDAPRERARSARHRPSARFRIGGSEIANVAHLRSARRLFSSRGATRFARVVRVRIVGATAGY